MKATKLTVYQKGWRIRFYPDGHNGRQVYSLQKRRRILFIQYWIEHDWHRTLDLLEHDNIKIFCKGNIHLSDTIFSHYFSGKALYSFKLIWPWRTK